MTPLRKGLSRAHGAFILDEEPEHQAMQSINIFLGFLLPNIFNMGGLRFSRTSLDQMSHNGNLRSRNQKFHGILDSFLPFLVKTFGTSHTTRYPR